MHYMGVTSMVKLQILYFLQVVSASIYIVQHVLHYIRWLLL